jgi:hypothetical protein
MKEKEQGCSIFGGQRRHALGDSVWAHAYLRGNVFARGLYSAAGSGATGLRRADARKHVQPFARSCAVSHLRLIDWYVVRGHLQFDATDDDAPAVHYLVADTHVGAFAPVEALQDWARPLVVFNPLGHWVVIIRGVMLKGVGLETLLPHYLSLLGLGVACSS